MITQSYIEGVKARVELVKKSYENSQDLDIYERELHTRNLIEYLGGLDYFLEEEKNRKKLLLEIHH